MGPEYGPLPPLKGSDVYTGFSGIVQLLHVSLIGRTR